MGEKVTIGNESTAAIMSSYWKRKVDEGDRLVRQSSLRSKEAILKILKILKI